MPAIVSDIVDLDGLEAVPIDRRLLPYWMADGPDDGRKEKRQQQAEQRPGDGYDDFVEG